MDRGCGLCLLGLCKQDSGNKPNIIKYLINNGEYTSYFYYRVLDSVASINLIWKGTAYSTLDSIAVLCNRENTDLSIQTPLDSVPSDAIRIE